MLNKTYKPKRPEFGSIKWNTNVKYSNEIVRKESIVNWIDQVVIEWIDLWSRSLIEDLAL